MRVIVLSNAFGRDMGYLENMLPKYLARSGVETHVVTMDICPYHSMKDFAKTYGEFKGAQNYEAGAVEWCHGYAVHVLPHRTVLGYPRMTGLSKKLHTLRPDIVQTTTPIGWPTLEAALLMPWLGYKLFTGNHHHASVFPLATKSAWHPERFRCFAMRTVPGFAAALATEKCYAIAPDCADLAARFFGVPRPKIELSPLGVDTELFFPSNTQQDKRWKLRQRLGFAPSDIVCVYSGRFTEDKNPALLAAAVEELAADGYPFRGLFIGKGVQEERIRRYPHCVVHSFVPVSELGDLYRAADVGVWPTQESTSMLDAAACGLPVIANDRMSITDRLEGNGLLYKLNDLEDLKRALFSLRDPDLRRRMGRIGAEKMLTQYSWQAIANARLQDYRNALVPLRRNAAQRETIAAATVKNSRAANTD